MIIWVNSQKFRTVKEICGHRNIVIKETEVTNKIIQVERTAPDSFCHAEHSGMEQGHNSIFKPVPLTFDEIRKSFERNKLLEITLTPTEHI